MRGTNYSAGVEGQVCGVLSYDGSAGQYVKWTPAWVVDAVGLADQLHHQTYRPPAASTIPCAGQTLVVMQSDGKVIIPKGNLNY